jgi:hypothetical protein
MMSHKIGLTVMLVPFVFLFIFAVTHGLNEYYDLGSNLGAALIQGVPCLFIAAISWLWPRKGGMVSIALSLLLLALSASGIIMSKVPAPGQEFPVLSLVELARSIFPYGILFIGSILALVSALMKKVGSPDWLPRLSTGAAGLNKLLVTGLLMISLLGIVFILFFFIGIGISGDSVLAINLFMGLALGLTYAATPLLFIIIAVWQWPRWGSAVVGALSIAVLIFLVIQLVSTDPSSPPRLPIPVIIAAGVVLIGSILVFISSRNRLNPFGGER